MEFRLTYSGLLFSTANDGGSRAVRRADHKHEIRQAFHPQLKRLWDITPFLKNGERSGPKVLALEGDMGGTPAPAYKSRYLAKKHTKFDWNFVPLVTKSLDLLCSVDILILRPSRPGAIIEEQGDLDGRLKTLLDALACPDENQNYDQRTPERSEKPFYVLLEDDRLVTRVAVETDQLLEFVTDNRDPNEVRIVITVKIRPNEMHLGNMQFG